MIEHLNNSKQFWLFLLLLQFLLGNVLAAEKCVTFNQREFCLFETPKSQQDARAFCLNWGGDLASIHSKEEAKNQTRRFLFFNIS